MLTQETKRHIDAARQVLVGVVPNPSSQIDQITNALIYKFMDDMDQSAIKAGGGPSFFVGDLERYAWTRLMDSRLGNQERMNLYSEALMKFSEAKQLPELFRGIFKSAFLPYRSPEVLGLFLKEIDYFDYSHSEELGTAYEYLLSIMGSQGDAGQFRTPRHIIDFIVAAVNPTKDDKVLDPACGTAGFLVSAYKHILEQHDGKNPDGSKNEEKPLTPDQRRAIMNNFEGYDVDPGMVRISQVNMYLHNFRNPKIYNYNTLSQEERWVDKFDVILANPPFMSPKGGVSTHNKFSVQSSRSEVLFVDYIMNHLRPKGRAGIIVPEGVIFQSGTAHKQLRKNLVEDGLYAVVSLPSGVFQPYSGVKTSILLFNNELAKRNIEILLVKVENDGFDLGAQRRPSNKNDLSHALEIINAWKDGKRIEGKMAVYVEKARIAENGDYNLSVDRYRMTTDYAGTKWPMVRLDDVFIEIRNGKNVDQIDEIGKYRVSRIQTIATGEVDLEKTKFTNDEVEENDFLKDGDILFSHINSIEHLAKTAIFEKTREKVVHGANLIRLRANQDKIIPKYALFIFKSKSFIETARSFAQKAVNQASINSTAIKSFKIPLPPLEIQQQIVAELDGYQNIISGAWQIADSWKPKIDIDSGWEKVKLGDVLSFIGSGSTPLGGQEVYSPDGILFIRSQNVLWGVCDFSDAVFIREDTYEQMGRSKVEKNDVLFNITGASIGRCAVYPEERKANVNQHVTILRCDKRLLPVFLMNTILDKSIQDQIWAVQGGASRQALNYQQIRLLEILLPSLETQKQIVEKIESERALVESAKKLIGIYEQKTKDVLSKLWAE